MTLSSGFVWGSFSMAAVLYDRERLRSKVGFVMEGGAHDAMPYDYAEGQYAVRVGLANLCTARPHLVGACSRLDPDNEPLPQPPPSAYGSSHEEDRPCHQVFIERRPPRPRALNEFSWFFYGTPMQAEGKQAERVQHTLQHQSQQQLSLQLPSLQQQVPVVETAIGATGDVEAVVGEACDGTPITQRMHDAFAELDRGTRLGSGSKDYSAAADAFARLSALAGGQTKRPECLSVLASPHSTRIISCVGGRTNG